MSPTRRQVVNAIAAGAVVPVTVASADAQTQEDREFSPNISFSPNNLVATVGERDGDVDPDTVTVYTADGAAHEFDGAAENDWEAGEAFDVGYTHDQSRARIDGWHGVLERVTATKDGETVSRTNDADSTLEVTCSLWKTPDQPPTEFTVLSEGARKQHWNRGEDDRSEDQRQYGSPGRALRTVAERNPEIEMRVDFGGCTPESERALRFDCTSVTVEPAELNQGEERIEDVRLRFADGSNEHPPGTADDADNGAFELPVTLSGSGGNEGKVLERLHFRVPGGEYTYWNLEAGECSPRQDTGSNDGADSNGDGTADGSGADSTGSDSDDGGTQSPDETSTPSGDSTGSRDDGGSGGSAGGGSGGSSGGGSSGESDSDEGDSGGLLGDDSDGGTDTRTPDESNTENVTVNSTDDGSATENASATADATSTENGSTGSGNETANGTANGSSDPELADGTDSEDQPGMGLLAGLGGILGVGELARRKLGPEDEE